METRYWFTLLRDASLNARTFSERVNDLEKQDYRRYQVGGSVGGPIVESRAHFFAAYERTQQDTRQAVKTLGLFPAEDGVYDCNEVQTAAIDGVIEYLDRYLKT